MSHQNNERHRSAAKGDIYLSPPTLVTHVTNIVTRWTNKTRPDVLWDPAAADGRLLLAFQNQGYMVRNSDLNPMNDRVQRLDFLQQGRRPPGARRLMMVFNPPFALPGQKNGITVFLNQSNKIMVPGEYAICIAPITFSNYNVLGRVTETLHLVEENYIRENICFFQPDTNKKKQVHLVVQVWQKRDQPSPTHGLHTKLRLTKEEEAALPFRMAGTHKVADGTPCFYILRKGTGKDVGMTLTSTEIVGKVWRKGRKTIDQPLCSVFTNKRVTFDTKQMTSILAIHVAPEARNTVFWTFHALYTSGVYARYLGHGMYQGVQTMNTSALKFMALYPDNIPTRDSLNITTNFIGEGNKIQIDKENILRQQRFANMYQTIKKRNTPYKVVRNLELRS